MVGVAKWSKAPGCGPGDRGFESLRPPQFRSFSGERCAHLAGMPARFVQASCVMRRLAIPSRKRRPSTSVNVVRNIPEAIAGSSLSARRAMGMSAPNMPAMRIFKRRARPTTSPSTQFILPSPSDDPTRMPKPIPLRTPMPISFANTYRTSPSCISPTAIPRTTIVMV